MSEQKTEVIILHETVLQSAAKDIVSIGALLAAIGVTRSALTRWLNGSRAIPDMLPLAIDGIRHRRMMQLVE